jgi:hypothetical protein
MLNIKKHPSWNKWVQLQSNNIIATQVCEESILLTKKTKGLIPNFNLEYSNILVDLKDQHSSIVVQEIIDMITNSFGEHIIDEELYSILLKISKLDNVNKKYIKKCLNLTYIENSAKVKAQVFNLKQMFCNLYKHMTLLNMHHVYEWIKEEDHRLSPQYTMYEMIHFTNNELIIKINSATLLSAIGSPAWCVTHKRAYANSYLSRYDCYLLFKRGESSIEVTGFNFSIGLELVMSIFNHYNDLSITSDKTQYVKYMKSNMSKDDMYKNVDKIKTTLGKKVFQAWSNDIKPNDIPHVYEGLTVSELDDIIKIFQKEDLYKSAFFEYMGELQSSHTTQYVEWIEFMFEQSNWINSEIPVIYKYIINNDLKDVYVEKFIQESKRLQMDKWTKKLQSFIKSK